MSRDLEKYQQIEQSINKKFHKALWRPFINALKEYELIQPGDRIAACISGGKDSFLNAKLLQMLQRHSDMPFELVFLMMDPGYQTENRRAVEENARLLNIPLTIFESDIFDVTANVGSAGNACYLCARMRRGYLYSKAKELGCNKIALGHHFSDVIETTLMGMFYGSQLQAMQPMLHSSKRKEIKLLIRQLRETNPGIERNIFNSIHAVHLDTFPGYKTEGVYHSFLERFEQKKDGDGNG